MQEDLEDSKDLLEQDAEFLEAVEAVDVVPMELKLGMEAEPGGAGRPSAGPVPDDSDLFEQAVRRWRK